ncbi:MAG: helix-turn-helix domain-containing protein [Clostridia bacterium]|nr:helix-turn-helix domain-containing protein [Clostridia bacterium]
MKIINLGSCNIDYVYSLDHIVKVGETEATDRLEIFPGGKGLNQSIAIARAGSSVFHAGCVGRDGGLLVDLLSESGADVSLLQTVEGQNGHAIIQVDTKGNNAIFLFAGSNAMVSKDYIEAVLSHFSEGDLLVLQNEISNVDYAIRRAHKRGLRIVFNPSPFRDAIKEIDFGMLSYLILNEVEAAAISGCESPEEAVHFFREHYPTLGVMLTLGEDGCVLIENGRELWQSAFCVDAVDTTAAGDTFTGYFVSELAKGSDPKTRLKIACAASALAVSRKGAAPSIPTRGEVLSVLSRLTPRDSHQKDTLLKRKIDEYLDGSLASATLSGLAKKLGYSSAYTGSLVKRLVGDSFSKYLQAKRLQLAANLLLNTDLSVEDVIRQVGYENQSFFRKRFQEKYGKSPLQFRNREVCQNEQ